MSTGAVNEDYKEEDEKDAEDEENEEDYKEEDEDDEEDEEDEEDENEEDTRKIKRRVMDTKMNEWRWNFNPDNLNYSSSPEEKVEL